jgi:hypothetical protein
LRLMGRKMLVALMMEDKFSGEDLHSMDADDEMLAAMARELVEKGVVGDSADAVWKNCAKNGQPISHQRLPPRQFRQWKWSPKFLTCSQGFENSGFKFLLLIKKQLFFGRAVIVERLL